MTPGLFRCPTDAGHGTLYAINGVSGWWCPSAIHDGRPGANPPIPASRNFFTFAEIDSRTPLATSALPGDPESRRAPVVKGAGAR